MTRRFAIVFIVFSLVGFSGCAESNEPHDQLPPDCGCDDQPDGSACVDTEQPEPDGGVSGWRMTWAARAGGEMIYEPFPVEIVWDLASLSDGSVLVTGRYDSEAVFGAGEPNETTLPASMPGNPDDENDFIARYDPKGELMWAEGSLGSGTTMGGMSVERAASDALWMVAGYEGEMSIGLGQPNETTLSADSFEQSGTYSIALARFSVNGALDWAIRASDAEWNSIFHGAAALPDGSIVVGGFFSVGLALAPDTPQEMIFTTPDSGDEDAVLARFDADGSLVWARQLSSPGIEDITSVVRLLGGELLVAGLFQQSVLFGAGEANETWLFCGDGVADGGGDDEAKRCPFLAAYSENGDLLWVKDPGFTFFCEPGVQADRIVAAPDGGFALSSIFVGSGLLGAGEPNESAIGPTSGDDYDVVVARYDADGALLWARQIVGETENWTEIFVNIGYPMAFLDSGELVVGGTYRYGAPVFGQGEPNETTLPDTNAYRIFFSMFYPNGNLAWAISPHGGCNMNTVGAVAAYGDSAFFVGGSFGNTVAFGTSSADRVPMTASGDSDIFVLRFDRTGNP